MAVEFCIWLWRMYRFKRKQERLALQQAKVLVQGQKSNALKGFLQ